MDRTFNIKELDWYLIILTLLLITIGFAVIYSATSAMGPQDINTCYKQVLWFFIGLIFVILIFLLPTKVIYAFAYFAYILALLGLIIVLFQTKTRGVERWIGFAGISIQPSEFAKIAVITALARFLSQSKINQNRLRDLVGTFILVGIPIYLVNKQPDLGTSMVFLALIIPMLYWTGVPTFTLFVLISPFISTIASFNFYFFLIWMLIVVGVLILSKKPLIVIIGLFAVNISVGIAADPLWKTLTPYQQKRILSVLDKEKDPMGASYQGLQSLYAIGSGGLEGKGFKKGTQSQLRFLPKQHNDFIFSVLGEELGFVGVSIVLLLFYLLIVHLITIAANLKNIFESLFVVGYATILLFHVSVNTLMTVGWFPVTGLPLPFLSSGGSFLITLMIMTGIVLNFNYNKNR
ncbi:rod shape-determining protein RodA [candidate division KSB1 bacterium]